MGAGIATEFRERYPEMYEEYRRRCKVTPREFNIGDIFLWKSEDRPWERVMDHAVRILRKRFKVLRVRQLVSNRQEVTLFLRRKD